MRVGSSCLVAVLVAAIAALPSEPLTPYGGDVESVTPVMQSAGADASQPADADATQQQAEASIAQVEADVRLMDSFANAVRRDLTEQDKVKQGIIHALGYFRRQEELAQDERDGCHSKTQRLEDEVASLQRQIKALEAEKMALAADKAMLTEANKKVLAQVNSVFAFGQAVQLGLAFKGVALDGAPNASTAAAASGAS